MKRRRIQLCQALVWVLVLSLASTQVDAASSQQAVAVARKNKKSKEIRTISTRNAFRAGVLLAFNSGYINGCCLSGIYDNTKQAVAAVTGAYTTSALGLAAGNFAQFESQIKILFCFISGSAIAGFLNPYPVPFELSESCGPAFMIGSLLLFTASSMASNNPSTKAYFRLAAVANGIQNSVTSVHTSNLIRTTHYTGISSDMGTFVGQILGGNEQNLSKLKIFSGLALSFWLGGFVSFYATQAFASSSLLFSALLYGLIGCGLALL